MPTTEIHDDPPGTICKAFYTTVAHQRSGEITVWQHVNILYFQQESKRFITIFAVIDQGNQDTPCIAIHCLFTGFQISPVQIINLVIAGCNNHISLLYFIL